MTETDAARAKKAREIVFDGIMPILPLEYFDSHN